MSSHKTTNTESYYREIIHKVCENIKEEFLNEGIAEDVIAEMKKV